MVSTSSASCPLVHIPELYKAVLENLEEGVIIVNKDLCVRYLNSRAASLTTATYGFVYTIGQSVLDPLPKRRRAAVAAIYERVLAGETVTYEVEVPQPEGEPEWLHCCDKPLYDSTGAVQGVSVLVSNITAKKRLAAAEAKQAELQEQTLQSRLLFEEFMQNAPLVAWITDATGCVPYMNPAFLSQYGISPAAAGSSVYDLFPAQQAIDWHLQNLRVLKEGALLEATERMQGSDSATHTYKVYRFPIQHNGASMVAAWAVDITAQSELERQLKRHLEQYYYIIEATSDAIYDWNLADNQVLRGSNFATLFGYIDHDVTIAQHYEAIHESDRKRIQNSHAHALSDPLAQGWALEYRYRCADGGYKQVLDRASIVWEGDKPQRVLGALQNVTEQKELHKKLLQGEKDKKREIVRSIIEAQEKERRKLSVELHDNVNQMLSSCKLLLEVACDGGANALELTRKSFRGVSQVIQEIRKISHELNPSALEDVGLSDAITEMLGIINSTGKIAIEFRHTGIAGDADTLRNEDNVAIYRIIQEQVNNILKHSAASKASVELARESKGIRLVIKDNGVGFDVAKAKKGHGIRNIQSRVDYYGGNFDMQSDEGKGSCLTIFLGLECV